MNKEKWMTKIFDLKCDYEFEEAEKLKLKGIKNGLKMTPKEEWILDITSMAWKGEFKNADKLLKKGLKKGVKLTKNDASDIISSCGPDIRYSFVNQLIKMGGKFLYNIHHYDYAKYIINDKPNVDNDMLKGAKLVVKYYDENYQ